MGKISPVSIKYMIHAKFIAQGAIEKPDVIGAVFGQTEGLLGSELEMRELQKEGKIGRIDVNLKTSDGKTIGKITIPSSLDKSETTIIAAAIETIERIGPTDATIEVEKIEDIRGNKREYIIERAKKLLEKIEGAADSRDIEDAVRISSKLSKLKEYGEEKLPAGDLSNEEIIIVEGRADVINLIKNRVNNVIGMNGTILPETIKELSLDRQTTLFIDGDRGGRLIAKNVIENARIDYVAIAPDGKEVEELTGKEILLCLRKKVPVDEFAKQLKRRKFSRSDRKEKIKDRPIRTTSKSTETIKTKKAKLSEKEKEKLKEMVDDLIGTRGAFLIDKNLEIIKKVSSSEIVSSINKSKKKIYVIVMDCTATSSVIRAAERAGCKHLIARNFACSEDTDVNLISL